MKKRNSRKPFISALEQRVLFDGAAVATAVDVLDNSNFTATQTDSTTTNDVTNNSADNIVHEAQAVQSLDRREIAFVDVNVNDYQTLVDGIGNNVEVYLVSSVDDIKSVLDTQTNIDAIHILSHGSTGEINIGNDVLNQDTLSSYDAMLQSMKNSLSQDGDIMLYGCNVASDGTGQDFIKTLATITEADVAASNDVTGSATLGGDWNLEVNTGIIDTNEIVVNDFSGELGVPSISGLNNLSYTEGDGSVIVDGSVTITNGSSYDGKYIEFSITGATTTETLTLTNSANVNASGAISFSGSTVYLGNGSSKDAIGSIDSTYNGINGQKLRINFVSSFNNPSFETGTLSGWTAMNQMINLGSTVIAGWTSQDTSTYTDNPSLGGNDNDVPSSASYSTTISSTEYSSGSYSLQLTSTMTTLNGYDVVHGPAVYSDIFEATAGDVIYFDWRAYAGGDDFDAFGYIVNTTTGAQIEVLDATGTSNTAWTTKATTISSSGSYRFVFVNGTYDASGGKAAGGQLFIDNVRVYGSKVNDSVISTIASQIAYNNTSDNPSSTRTFNITALSATNNSATNSLTINITAVNDAPVATAASFTTNEDTAYTGTLVATDVDNASLTYSINTAPSHGTVTITNSSTGAYTYTPTANYNGTDSFTFKASDGSLTSAAATVNVTVTAVNDAPIIESTTTVDYNIANGIAKVISPSITISDVDNTTLASATVSISTGFVSGDILAFTNNNSTTYGNITGSYNSSTGVLTLTSSGNTATLAQFEAALESVTYMSSATNLADGTRTISWKVNDGTVNSSVDTSTINVYRDTDGDGIKDSIDIDDDNDGILDIYESTANFQWASGYSASGNTATGTINGIGFTYTLTDLSNSALSIQTISMFSPSTFPSTYNIPTGTSIKNTDASINTITFSSTILNPILAFSSIGQSSVPVPIEFSNDVTVLWETATTANAGDIITVGNSITGNEGFMIVKLVGEYNQISFKYKAAENYVTFAFGADVRQDIDTDGDGIVDRLDTDSDNDGVLDNVEAQVKGGFGVSNLSTLTGYIAPSGVDIDLDGLDDAYDHDTTTSLKMLASASQGLTPIDSNSNGIADYLVDEAPNLTIGTLNSHDGTTTSSTVIAPNLTITDVENNNTLSQAKIQVNNFVSGDTLSFTNNSSTMGSISGSYNSSTGVLTLSGTGTLDQYEAALRAVKYSKTNSDTTDRSFSFTVGSAIPYSGNGHYYEAVYVSGGITWTDAKAAAEAKILYGMKGYLATITSAAENAFILSKLPADGWIGGSDAAVEGTWRWVSGPESGTLMSYTNWASGEPNNSGGNEDAAEFYASNGTGKWNDLHDTGTKLTYYIVEYGGTTGDAIPTISATATMVINDKPSIESTTTITYTENATAKIISPSLTISDADSTTLANATVSITSNFTTGDVLDFINDNTTMYGNITGNYNSSTGVLSLSSVGSTATLAQWQSALRNVTYYSTSETLSTSAISRTVSWIISDGSLNSTTDTSTITVTGVNDAPIATAASFTTNEDTLYSGTLSATDIDSSSFTYSINTNASHGTVTITNASTGAYSYTPASNYNGTDSFIFAVSDGSLTSTATVDITVNPVNDKPTIESTTTINYTEHDLPVIVSPSVIIGDIDSTTISSATVSITSSFTTGDVLNFTNDNSTSYGNISASYNATTGILTLSSSDSSATMTQWKNALENIKFSISSTIDVVNNGTRTISWKVNDGLLDSLIDTSTINVQGYGSMPYIYGTDKATVNEDSSVSLSGFTVGDDDTTTLTVSVVATHGNLSLGTTTGITGYSSATKTILITGTSTNLTNALNSMVYTPDSNYNGTDELVIKASDDSGISWSDYYVSRTGLFYNTTNQHYYEYVYSPGITWDNAKIAAESRSYLGLGGYLATVTTTAENDLIKSKLGGDGWFGASDAANEGTWVWVGGPEIGQIVSFNGWNSGEPNNSGGNEDAAQYIGSSGKWNDLPNTYGLNGYVVEYGGLSTDASTKPTAAKLTITVNSVNDLPVNHNVPSSKTINEDTTIVFSTGNSNAITISDDDSILDSSVTLTTTVSIGSGKGTLTAISNSGGATITNNGTTAVQISGTVTEINAALDGLTYQPTLNANGNTYTTITVTTNDGMATDTDTITVNITPVDDLPVANSMAATVGVGSAQLFSYFQPNFFDVDGDLPVAIKLLTSPDKGQFEHWNSVNSSWELVTITSDTPLIIAMSDMNNYRFNALNESNTSTTVQWQIKTAGNITDTGWSNTATGTISILSYAANDRPNVSITYPTGTTTGTSDTSTIESPDSSNPVSSVTTITSNNIITINEDGQTATITLTYSDSVTPAQFMQGVMTSSNTRLIDFTDSSTFTITQNVTSNVGTITLVLKPKPNMYGDTLITLGAFDGQKTTQETFTLHVNSVNEQAITNNFTKIIDEDNNFYFSTINPSDIYHDANDLNANTNVSIVDYNTQMGIIQDAMLNPSDSDKQTAKVTAIQTLVDANYFPQSFIIDTLPIYGDLYLGTTKITNTNYTVAIADLEKLVYQPDANYNGTDSFTWHALDKEGLATTTKTATFTINPVNDLPEISVGSGDSSSKNIFETNDGLSTSGTLSVIDVDIPQTVSVSVVDVVASGVTTGLVLDNTTLFTMLSVDSGDVINNVSTTGTISWSFNSNGEAFNYLASGETLTLTYTIKATDDNNPTTNDTQTVTITITGTNDTPNITVESGNSDSASLTETNSTLSSNGTLSVIDLDRTDIITTSHIVASVQKDANGNVMTTDSNEPNNTLLHDMLSITPTPIDGTHQTGTISWSFNSNGEAFNYLASGETLTLTYTIKATDDNNPTTNDTQIVTITITGTNDTPVVSLVNIDEKTPFGKEYSKLTAYLFSDLDRTDVFKFTASNLPLGLNINPITGEISGRAVQSGFFDIVVTATDSGTPNLSVSRTYNLLVIAPPQPEVAKVVETPVVLEKLNTNSDITLNNFNSTNSNLGVLNYNLNSGVAADTGSGYLGTSTSKNVLDNQVTTKTNNNAEQTTQSSNNQGSIAQKNDIKSSVQANVDLNVTNDGQVRFNDNNQNSFSIVGIKIEDIKVNNNSIEVKIVNTAEIQHYIVTQANGESLPQGIIFDPKTGNIKGTIPENMNELNLSIKATNADGTTSILNLKIDLKQYKLKPQAELNDRFIGLKEQLAFENEKSNGYGSYITKLFA